jgi:hypothetical protein
MRPSESFYGFNVQTAGWGILKNLTNPNTLQVGNVTIMTKEACELKASRLTKKIIRSNNIIICTISYPYVLLRPVSY